MFDISIQEKSVNLHVASQISGLYKSISHSFTKLFFTLITGIHCQQNDNFFHAHIVRLSKLYSLASNTVSSSITQVHSDHVQNDLAVAT